MKKISAPREDRFSTCRRAIAWVALGLFVSLSIGANAQSCPAVSPSSTSLVLPLNTYYPAGAAPGGVMTAGSTSLYVGAKDVPRGSFSDVAAGDVLLVVQMQGADIDTSDNNRYGDGIGDGSRGYTTTGDYAGGFVSNANYTAGQYEYVVATGPVSGGVIPIASGLANSYSVRAATSTLGARTYQVIRVPQFAALALTNYVAAPPWNGSTGGILALDVAGNLNFIGGTLDVSGRGFRGGGALNFNRAWTPFQYNYVTTTDDAAPGGGVKGEGISGTPVRWYQPLLAATVQSTGSGYPGGDYARGAPGNAGGGSNQHNAGGGGGGNGGVGGNGGRSWNQNQNSYFGEDIGGFGGVALGGNRIFLGGGGGAADINNQSTNSTGSGGAGGGAILIRAGNITGYGTLNARGADAPDGLLNATDGAGAGGAGGTVLITTATGSIPFGLGIDLRGGKGGNNSMGGVNETDGPGGGGGGGRLLASTSGGNVQLSGGSPGILFNSINPSNNSTNGAAAGQSGTTLTIAPGSVPGVQPASNCYPNLTVTKSTSTPTLLPGATQATYTIAVTNSGTGAANGVVFTDTLPAPFANSTIAPIVTLANGATRSTIRQASPGTSSLVFGTFDLPGKPAPPYASATVTFVADINTASAGKYDNSAVVNFVDPTTPVAGATVTPGGTYAAGGTVLGTNYNGALVANTADDVTVVRGPVVAKSFASSQIATGGTVALTITLTNPNPQLAMSAVSLLDYLPAGLFVAATPALTQTPVGCAGTIVAGSAPGDSRIQTSSATLAAAASCQIQVNVTSNTAGPVTNVIPVGNVTGTVASSVLTSTADATASLSVFAPPIITKNFAPNNISLGAQSTLTVTIANPTGNPAALTGVAFTDNYPAGVTNVTAGTAAFTAASTAAGCTGTIASPNGATPGVSGSGITIPVNTVCVISVVVTKSTASPAGGDINTTSSVTATGPVALNGNIATDTLKVSAGSLAPTVTKSFASNIGAVGVPVAMTFVIQNPNSAALTVSSFVDNFPANMTLANTTVTNSCGLTLVNQSNAALAVGNTGIQITGGTLPANGSCTLTVNIQVSAAGEYVNTASALLTTSAPAANIANAKLTAVAAPTVSTSFTPSTIYVGGTSVLRIRISNPAGNAIPLSGLAFSDSLPAGVSIASVAGFSSSCAGTVSPGQTPGNTSIVLTGGVLPVAGTCEISVNVTSATAGTVSNSTGVVSTSAGVSGASATASLTVDGNLLPPAVEKSFSPSRAAVGATTTLRLFLTNPNVNVPLTGVSVSDTFPANMSVTASPGAVSGVVSQFNPCGLTFTGGQSTNTNVTVTGATLAPGQTCALRLSVSVSAIGTALNTTGNITATGPVALTGDTGSAALFVQGLVPPVLSKSFLPSQIPATGKSRLTFDIVNSNPTDPLANIAFTDTFPAGMVIATPPNLSNPCNLTLTGGAAGNNNINVTGGAVAAGTTCQISVDVTYTGANGNITNTTSAITSTSSSAGNSAAAVLTIVDAQPPTISKSFSPSQIPPGGQSTLTVTVTNPNTGFALSGVAFSDTYPTNLANVTTGPIAASGSGCVAATAAVGSTGALSLTAGTIPAGGSCTYSVPVTKTGAGNVVNPATGVVTVTATGPVALTGNGATASLGVGTVLPPGVSKFFEPDSISEGGTSVLTLNFSNPNSGTTLAGLTLTDTFPAGLSVTGTQSAASGVISSANTCGLVYTTTGSNNVTVTSGQIPTNGNCVLAINVTKALAGTVTNTTGNVASTNGGTGNAASAALKVKTLPPIVTKAFSVAQVASNVNFALTITVQNPNAAALTGVSFTDTYPTGLVNAATPAAAISGTGCTGTLTAAAAGASFALASGTIPGNTTCTYTVQILRNVTTTPLTNTVGNVTSTGPEVVVGNTASATVTRTGTNPLVLSKIFSPAFIPIGGTSLLTFTIANPNAAAATPAFTDTFPIGLVIGATPGMTNTCGLTITGGTAGSGNINVTGGTVPANGTCTVSVIVTSQSSASYSNTTSAITINGGAPNGAAANALLTVGDGVLPPIVEKEFIPSIALAGAANTVQLRITLRNPNPSTNLTGIALTDTFPGDMQVAPTPGYQATGVCTGLTVAGNTSGSTTLTLSTLTLNAAAGSCSIILNVRRSGGAAGSLTNTTGNVTATGPLALTGNAASATATWVAAGTYSPPSITKAFSPSVVPINGVSRMTLTIANPNAVNLTGVAFTDAFPGTMVIAATPNLLNNCNLPITGGAAGNNNINVTTTSLGKNATCTIAVDVIATAAGNLTNTTSAISSTEGGAGNRGSATLSVQQVSPPFLTKAFIPASIQPGGVSELRLTVNNPNQALALTGINFNDNFPAGLTVHSSVAALSGVVSEFNTCGLVFANGVSGSTAINVSNGTPSAGGSCVLRIPVTKATGGSVTNTAGPVGSTNGGTGNSATAGLDIATQPPQITAAFGPKVFVSGGTSQLSLTIVNPNSTTSLSQIAFVNAFPAGLSIAAGAGAQSGVVNSTFNTCGLQFTNGAPANTSVSITAGQNQSIAAGDTCTLVFNVTSSTVGQQTNTTSTISSANGGTGNAGSDTYRVAPALIPIALTKQFAPATLNAGGTTELVLNFENLNTGSAVTGVQVVDTFPGGIVIASSPGVTSGVASATNNCGFTFTTAGGNNLTVTGGTIPAGSTCYIRINVTAPNAGTWTNTTGTVTSSTPGVGAGTAASAVLTVAPALQAQVLTKQISPAIIGAGGVTQMQITIRNPNLTVPLTSLGFEDILPAGVTVAADPALSNTCGGVAEGATGAGAYGTVTSGNTKVRITNGVLTAGATCIVNVNLTSTTPGTVTNTVTTNTASAGTNVLVGANPSAPLTVVVPTLQKVYLPTTIAVGATSTLEFTVTNSGGNPQQTGIGFVDTLAAAVVVAGTPNIQTTCPLGGATFAAPSGALTVSGASNVLTVSGLNLNAGVASCRVRIDVVSNTAGVYPNVAANMTSATRVDVSAVNSTLTVVQASLNKAFSPTTIDQGGTSTLTFTLTNGAGNPAQSGIAFIDTLPANVVVAAVPNLASTCPSGIGVVAPAGGGTISVAGAPMNNGQASCTVSVDVTSNVPGGPYNNTSANISGLTRLTNSVTTSGLTVQAKPTLTKAFSPATIGVGQTSTLTFTISNPAGAPARSGITFTDALPTNVVIAAIPNVVNSCGGTPTITATAGGTSFAVGGTGVNAAAGASTCTVSVAVTSATAGAYVNGAAQITATSANLINGVTNQSLTVVQASMNKAFAPTTIDQGGTSTLTFTLTNGAGNPAQSGISFTDTLPTNVVVAAVPNIASTCPSGAGVVTAAAGSGSIAVAGASMNNAQATCTISVDVTSSVPGGPYNNTSANISGLARVTNSVTTSGLTVQAKPTLTKSFGSANVALNGTTTLVFTVANTAAGNVSRTGLSFTDTLQAGLQIANPTAPSSTGCGTPTFTAVNATQAFTASAIDVAAGATCTITLTVRGVTAGVRQNTTADITAISALLTNGVTAQTLNVYAAPTLTKAFGAASISSGGATTMTLVLTNPAANPGATTMQVDDTFPTGLTLQNTTFTFTPAACGTVTKTSGAASAAGDNNVRLTTNSIAAGSTCQVQVNVTSSTAGSITNTTNAPVGLTPVATTGTAASASLAVTAAPVVTKSFVSTNVAVGGTTTMNITIQNPAANTVALTGVAFTDTYPAGLTGAVTATASPGTCTGTLTAASGSLTLAGGTIPVATTCTYSVVATGATVGAKVNSTGSVTSTNAPAGTAASATLNVYTAPTVTKAFGATIDTGASTTLTFAFTNPATNPGTLTGIAVNDTFPTSPGAMTLANAVVGGTCTATVLNRIGGALATGNTGVQISGISLNAGASCTVIVNVTAGVAGTYNNTTTAVTASGPVALTGTTANAALTVQAKPVLTKAFAATNIGVGQTTTLTFTISNTAANTVNRTGLAFTDTLPGAGALTATTTTPQCGGASVVVSGASNNIITVTNAAVNAGLSCTITATITGVTPGSYINGPTNNSISGVSANLTNSVTDQTLNVRQATVAKTFGAASIADGATTSLVFTITNGTGSPAQSGLAMGDTLPTGLRFNSATPAVAYSTGCSGPAAAAYDGPTRVLSGITGVAMTTGTASCTVTVAGLTNTATQTNASCAANPAAFTNLSTNVSTTRLTNASTDQCLVVAQVNASLTKSWSSATINDAGSTNLVFTLTNAGTNPAQSGIAFTESLPASLHFTSATPTVTYGAGCSGSSAVAIGAPDTIAFSGVSMAALTASCTITVSGVTNRSGLLNASCASNPAAFTNTTTNISGVANVTNAVTSQCLVVNAVPVVLTKSWGTTSIVDGASTTLAFTLTNTGTNPAQSGISFTESLPTGLRFTSAAPAVAFGAGCSGTTSVVQGTPDTVAFSGVAISSGTSSCVITVTGVTNRSGQINTSCASSPAAFTNTASRISGTTNLTNSVTPQCLAVTAQSPTISKAFAPSTIAAGGTSTMSFTITNPNSVPLTSANFTDTSTNIRVSGAQTVTGCSGSNAFANNQTGALSFTGLTIPAAGNCTISVLVTSTTPGVLPNTASGVASAEAATGAVSNTANLTVNAAAPTITKVFVTPTIAVGGTSQIDFTITNPNAAPLTGAGFTDTLTNMFVNATGAATGTCTGASTNSYTVNQTGVITVTGLTIPASGSCTVSIVVKSNTPGTHPNFATGVTSNEAPAGANSATVNLTVTATAPTISKVFLPNPIVSGGVSTLTITINNPNAAPITVTGVTDNFPTSPGAGLVRAATPNASTTCASGVVTHTSSSVTLTGGAVPANGSCTFQINVSASTAGSYLNTIAAGALTTSAGSNAAPATATLTVNPAADVSVTKTGPATIPWGTTVTYTVVVTNAGPDAANLTTVTDSIPAALTSVAAVCGSPVGGAACGTVNLSGNNLSSTITALPANSSVTFTITGTAPSGGTLTNAATAIVPSGVSDPDDPARTGAGNNTSATVTTIVQSPDLRITKVASASTFTVGSNVSYTLQPSNAGTLATSGVMTVVDTLPPGLSYVAAGSGGSGWSCSLVGQDVTCTTSAVIPAGGSGTAITINVQVLSNAVPSVTNTATIAGGNEPAVNSANNSAVSVVSVTGAAVNTFLTDGAQTGIPGSSVLYTHSFNAGSAGSVAFTYVQTPSPNIGGWSVQLYRDNNCNGQLDGSDGTVEITGTSFPVTAGQQICLIAKSNIPATAPAGALDVISVTATFTPASGPVVTYARVDVTTVGAASGAGLVLTKSVRNVTQGGSVGTTNSAKPGDVLEYVITYSNSSNSPLSTIIVSDATPAFTTFVSASCMTPPYPNNITACSVSTQPAVGAAGAIQWQLTGSLGAGRSGTVLFRVTVQ